MTTAGAPFSQISQVPSGPLPLPKKEPFSSSFRPSLHLLSQFPSLDPSSPPSHLLQTPPPLPLQRLPQLPHPPQLHTPPPSQPKPKTLSKQARMLTPTPSLLFLLLLFLAATSNCSQVPGADAPPEPAARMVPMATATGAGFSAMVLNETRRRLGSFQLCAPCTCCGGPRGVCVLSPCCYAINCNIPNRPFGFCSFTPKSCDCLGCNL